MCPTSYLSPVDYAMRAKLLCLFALLAPLTWLFGNVLWHGRIFNFRDIAHYYRPLWQWTSNEWSAGRVPLWNSLDGLGMPVHADPTASLFYPGQLLFALPLDFTTRLNLYVVLHVLLAAGMLYYAARGLGASLVGATAGALSYALGGQVLFQYCNPIYLVSAAWLPLAILAMHRMLTQRSPRWAVVLAVTLALMTLGGDPQMAYHALMIAVVYAWMLGRSEKQAEAAEKRERPPLLCWRPALIGLASLVALLLAAIQVLPSAQWSSRSARAAFDQPRSVWEVTLYLYEVQTAQRTPLTSVTHDIASGLFAAPQEETHHEHVYEFSVGPWRWLEFICPNIGGQMFPIHQRWMTAIPAESRIWTPSLYLGLAPLLVAVGSFSLRRQADVTTRWLSWLIVSGLVGSLGAYGVGWLAQELSGGAQSTKAIGSPVGGLYWFFVVLLPGYVQFRYPAKLLVFASLGLSLLAARGWETFGRGESKFSRSIAFGIGGLSCALLLIVGVAHVPLANWLQAIPPEFPFGAFDAGGSLRGIAFSLAHTAIVALIMGGLLLWGQRYQAFSVGLLLLTAVDLSVANSWLVTSSPANVLAASDEPTLDPLPNGGNAVRFYRTPLAGMETFIASQPPSRERLDQLLVWESQSLAERWYLAANVNMIDATTSIEPLDLQSATSAATGGATYYFACDLLAIDGVQPSAGMFGGEVNPFALLISPTRPHPRPRAYLPNRLTVMDPLVVAAPAIVAERSEAVIAASQADQSMAIIEDANLALDRPGRLMEFDNAGATCQITRYEHNQVEIAVDSPQDSLLVLADYYSPDWIAEVVDPATGAKQSTPIYRTNRVLRGVMVPAGKHLVIFRYRPWLLYLGFAISGVAWGYLGVGLVFASWRQRRIHRSDR